MRIYNFLKLTGDNFYCNFFSWTSRPIIRETCCLIMDPSTAVLKWVLIQSFLSSSFTKQNVKSVLKQCPCVIFVVRQSVFAVQLRSQRIPKQKYFWGMYAYIYIHRLHLTRNTVTLPRLKYRWNSWLWPGACFKLNYGRKHRQKW